ncbi:MAG: hypothetical protein HWE22_17530 [Flavobacteriales bacterium]|nr:hypothetical protein [Flavobacteriales bacterium]
MDKEKDIFDHLKARKTPTPDASYFQSLAQSVIDSQPKKTGTKQEETPIIPLYKRPAVWIGTVAAIAAIFIVGFLVVNFNQTSVDDTNPLVALNEIPSTEVYDYIDENIDDFDTDLIVEALDASSVSNMTLINEPAVVETPVEETKSTPEKISFDDINTEDIINYLNEEGISPEDFEEDSFI